MLSDEMIMKYDVSRETFSKLEIYHALLLKWQKAVNLVSPATIEEAWTRHFLDSVQLVEYIPDSVKVIADLGVGAGFPGMVLAILRPDLEIHLVESDYKKCQFLANVSRETFLSVHIHNKRIGDVYGDIAPDLVSARALASLDKLFGYAMPWARENADLKLLFLKGARVGEEIEAARGSYAFECESFPSVTDDSAQILRISGLSAVN